METSHKNVKVKDPRECQGKWAHNNVKVNGSTAMLK